MDMERSFYKELTQKYAAAKKITKLPQAVQDQILADRQTKIDEKSSEIEQLESKIAQLQAECNKLKSQHDDLKAEHQFFVHNIEEASIPAFILKHGINCSKYSTELDEDYYVRLIKDHYASFTDVYNFFTAEVEEYGKQEFIKNKSLFSKFFNDNCILDNEYALLNKWPFNFSSKTFQKDNLDELFFDILQSNPQLVCNYAEKVKNQTPIAFITSCIEKHFDKYTGLNRFLQFVLNDTCKTKSDELNFSKEVLNLLQVIAKRAHQTPEEYLKNGLSGSFSDSAKFAENHLDLIDAYIHAISKTPSDLVKNFLDFFDNQALPFCLIETPNECYTILDVVLAQLAYQNQLTQQDIDFIFDAHSKAFKNSSAKSSATALLQNSIFINYCISNFDISEKLKKLVKDSDNPLCCDLFDKNLMEYFESQDRLLTMKNMNAFVCGLDPNNLQNFIRSESMLYAIRNFLFDSETISYLHIASKFMFNKDSIFSVFEENWSDKEFKQQYIQLNEALHLLPYTDQQKSEIGEILASRADAREAFCSIVESHLQNDYDFNALRSSLSKKTKKNLFNI